MKIYTVCNQKGGVGKTTTTLNLGLALQGRGRRVLLVDADPQGNLSKATLGQDHPTGQSLSELIHDAVAGLPVEWAALIHAVTPGLDVIPSSRLLAAANSLLGTVSESGMVLDTALKGLPGGYDVVLIDCAPATDLLVINALNASDGVIVPTEPAEFSVDGLVGLVGTISHLQSTSNPRLKISKIVINKYDGRKKNHGEQTMEILGAFAGVVYPTPIPLLKEVEMSVTEPGVMSRLSRSKAWPIYQGIAEVMDDE